MIFAGALVNGAWERGLHAEQTEVEPPGIPASGPPGTAGHYVTGCSASLISPQTRQLPKLPRAEETSPAAAGGARAEYCIDSARITDNRQELNLIRAGHMVAGRRRIYPSGPAEPHRQRRTIRPGARVAVWFRRQAAPGWCPHAPVTFPGPGQAEFDLSSVPPGRHDVRLLAWATDPGATLAAVTLPTLAFGH